jgi:hypothetical protein
MQYQKPRTLPSISRLLTTQFALGGLQASETIFLFRTIQKAHQELRTLCESRPSDAPLHSVFGWSHSLWGRRINYNSLEDQIVWRGAKVFEHVGVDQLSRSIWGVCKKKTLEAFPQIKSIKTLYDINDSVRIVQCIEKLFGRQEQQTLRLVFKLRNKNYTYIGCKEIANFREYDSHSPPNDHEVMGYARCDYDLFVTPIKNSYLAFFAYM